MKRTESNGFIILVMVVALAATFVAKVVGDFLEPPKQTPPPSVQTQSQAPTPAPGDTTSSQLDSAPVIPIAAFAAAGRTGVGVASASPEASSTPPPLDAVPATMEDTLFIGDSRTVGLSEYGGLDGADFFCTTGMNVFTARTDGADVYNVGWVTLSDLLSSKTYNKVYVMLGINEIGYPFESILGEYKALLEDIQTAQPNALIFVQANLHVTASRSYTDDVVNNPAIDSYNALLAEFADNKRIFYIDANEIFDDANGALDENKAGDSAHPLGANYQEWGQWIAQKTGQILAGGQ